LIASIFKCFFKYIYFEKKIISIFLPFQCTILKIKNIYIYIYNIISIFLPLQCTILKIKNIYIYIYIYNIYIYIYILKPW
jgi:hypothetical protein